MRSQCVLVLALFLSFRSGRCEEYTSPFVPGFDRFARHQDIEQHIGGRLLITELSCTSCHKVKSDSLQPKLGPRLDGVGNRLRSDWLQKFLAAPMIVKPGTTMPDVLVGLKDDEKKHAIDALVAFLSGQQAPFPEIRASGANPVPHEFWLKGSPERGKQLYHQIGCVACHKPGEDHAGSIGKKSDLDKLLEQLEPEEIEELGLAAAARPVRSVPHGDLAAKYTHKSLTFFLLNPELARPSGRMPNLKLMPVEAADISAYLLREVSSESKQRSVPEVLRLQLQEEGRQRFAELNCASCHKINGEKPARHAKRLAELDLDAQRSCFGAPQEGLPNFKLGKAQIESIRTALSRLAKSLDNAKVNVDFQMLQLNCYACHERDKRGGVGRNRQSFFETVGHVDLGDEGRIPPPLTGVGRKLKKPWLSKVFSGTGNVRPHMIARMPAFPKPATEALPDMLVAADGPDQPSEADVFGDQSEIAEAGRLLLNIGCVQCHPMRGESLLGVVGIDLEGIPARVAPEWFREFLRDPAQLKHRTRMPTFFPNGKSPASSILDGNVDRQIAAMWTYLKDIEKHPLPKKIAEARSQSFELIPKDRPILLRTFMKHAGTHAIAVGFPEKVHFAFDAESVRLSQTWRGKFLDAHGTWFDRFTPPAVPLGKDSIDMPIGAPLALLENERQRWPKDSGYAFLGFRLDLRGVPTFLYRFKHFKVEECVEPKGGGLIRRFHVKKESRSNEKSTLWLRANVGKSIQREKANSNTNDKGLTTIVSEDFSLRGMVRNIDGQTEWILPVEVDSETTITLEYQWKNSDDK